MILFSEINLKCASANKRKFEKKIVRKETRAYQGRLQEEIYQTVKTIIKNLFHRINLIRKKPKKLNKVQLTVRVVTMSKMNEQNSLPIHLWLPTATVLYWGQL
ncbi:hypothetical protein OKW24_004631 [Peribacillus simplex]|nr:hypothetical protein [Peribacillus simplex]